MSQRNLRSRPRRKGRNPW